MTDTAKRDDNPREVAAVSDLNHADAPDEKITASMVEAGVSALLSDPDVSPEGVFFSPPDLAMKVYQAMRDRRLSEIDKSNARGRAKLNKRRAPIGTP